MWFLWYFDREQDHCRIYVNPTSLKTTTFHIEITWKSTHFYYITVSEVCAKILLLVSLRHENGRTSPHHGKTQNARFACSLV
jgi:hypothetical protein